MTTNARGSAELTERVAAVTGEPVVAVSSASSRGFMADHYRVTLRAGRTIFVKVAVSDFGRAALKREALAYDALGPRPFLPAVLAHDDDLLVLEDLGRAHWPPPWRDEDLARVHRVLDDIAATPAPEMLVGLDRRVWSASWAAVADNPRPLIALGLCTGEWLDAALDVLMPADACPLSGDTLVHGDFRSDNLCVVGDSAVVVDWAVAAKGRPDYDSTTFAIATAAETGARPEGICPDADPALVASVTSVLARYAPDANIPGPIRAVLEAQLRVALPWCARLFELAPLETHK